MKYLLLNFFVLIVVLVGDGIINKFTFFPDTSTEIPKEKIPNYIIEKWIKTKDGETLQAFFFKHIDDVKLPLVIYFHGNAGNVYHRFDEVQKLYEMNYNVLLISYRGYAKSTGKPSEKGIYIDGVAAVNFSKDSLNYQENELIIFGRSLGTTVAIDVAQNKFLKGVVLITPLTSGKDMASAMGMNSVKSLAGNSFNSLEKINNLKSQLLIVHGTNDEVVPYYMGKKLFDTYKGIKYMTTINGGKHNNLEITNPQLYWVDIKKFLNGN
jgi:fermentation-respiration switch protein FrsA (DUF1100 family)